MSPDHLCEEGPSHREDIEIPFHVIFFFSTILLFLYGIHLNAHFYLFGLIIRIFLWTYNFLSEIYRILLSWYFILQFNYYVGQKLQIPDCEEDQLNLSETAMPTIEAHLTVRQQIIFFHQNYFDKLRSIPIYIANTIMLHKVSRIHQSQ